MCIYALTFFEFFYINFKNKQNGAVEVSRFKLLSLETSADKQKIKSQLLSMGSPAKKRYIFARSPQSHIISIEISQPSALRLTNSEEQ